jgi:hypothetical protein|tara:strand:- start:1570 stop:1824 length:255 start_codon:yes stop_codon:yes gene_type:complete
MYGKRRVVISKKNQIIIAGVSPSSKGGTWNPIGIAIKRKEFVEAKFLNFENRMESRLTDENSTTLALPTLKETRDAIKKIYNID